MLSLKANITFQVRDNKFINKKDINRYLEHVCNKFADESADEFEFEKNGKKCFNINCTICKNDINCYINCISYEKTIQIAQGLLRLDTLNFLHYTFQVNSLELKELEDLNTNDIVVNFGTY